MFISILLAVVLSFHSAIQVHKPQTQVLGQHYVVTSTAYDSCSSGTIMADGHHTHWGAVANNFLPLGTKIKMDHPIYGRKYFTVEDRIGYGTQLDIWMPGCSDALTYGRREIGFRVVVDKK